MKTSTFFIMILTSLMFLPLTSEEAPARPVTELMDSVVGFTITIENDSGESSTVIYCGGTWITKNLILTARHCIWASDPVGSTLIDMGIDVNMVGQPMKFTTNEQYQYDGNVDLFRVTKQYRARVAYVDDLADIGLVYVADSDLPRADHRTITFSPRALVTGMSVQAIGHPNLLGWTHSRGSIASIRNKWRDESGAKFRVLQLSIDSIYNGSSGGPVMNERGDLIGVINGLSPTIPGVSFAVHLSEIDRMIEDATIELNDLLP